MASTLPLAVTQKSKNETTNFTSVKTLSESPDFNNSIPSSYTFDNENEIVTDPDEVNDPIPVIDYSLLVNGNHDQRTKTVHDIGKACEEWGFFMVINHFVPKSVMEKMVDQVFAFFNLREEEKQEYAGPTPNSKMISKSPPQSVGPPPIRFLIGSSTIYIRTPSPTVLVTRGVLRSLTSVAKWPKYMFISEDNPHLSSRETSAEYSKRTWKLGRELLKGISESLGLEANYIDRTMNLASGLQMLAANLYPPCPQPELAMGMPPHSDHGLLNLLIQNGVSGLQVLHNGKWINVSSTSNCFLVLVSDHLEVQNKPFLLIH
ncbi:flavonol synthase/flavanone 3-hydroxylase [Trifolium pratense]|uniref:Flavonol synthase/flavanone 3-hydroxylase n=1 Tax=Trifolium pratense TaxID=57577 RepID=A0A2K3LN60_TRIPR|nr:flavonol synthase/flavanone 3-hydroxylase [Trifolium pratense]PNX81011.1 flavonol synthase/flavanone 3-hydroxylase [Trifolium pratense]